MSCRVLTRWLILLGLAVAVGCFVAGVGPANADLLWYDGVTLQPGGDYVVGIDNLAGQSGGAGTFFANPWQATWAEHSVLATSLTRPGQIIPSIGGMISDVPTVYDWGLEITGRDMHPFVYPWGGFEPPVGTYYMGFLASWGHGGTLHHRAVEMYDGDITNDLYRTLQLGYSEGTGLGTKLTLAVRTSNPLPYVQYMATLAENVDFWQDHGTTHFVVLKFDMQASDGDPLTTEDNDVVSVYLDPVGLVEPATPSAQISVDDFLATHMGAVTNFVWDGSFTATPAAFDELWVADTSDPDMDGIFGFAEVANNTLPYAPWVPEPATVVLFELGAVGLLLAARRMRA